MFKQIMLITWADDANGDARAKAIDQAQSLVRADLSYLGESLPASHRGGDIVWHLHFADEASWQSSGADSAAELLEEHAAISNIDAAAYSVDTFNVTAPGLQNAVYRTLLVSTIPAKATPNLLESFAADVTAMPEHIPEILNWAMNPVKYSRGAERWAYVWEQEFARIEDLTGPYMTHAYHWAHVDRWFDPEMPEQIIDDSTLRHSASHLARSVMAHYPLS